MAARGISVAVCSSALFVGVKLVGGPKGLIRPLKEALDRMIATQRTGKTSDSTAGTDQPIKAKEENSNRKGLGDNVTPVNRPKQGNAQSGTAKTRQAGDQKQKQTKFIRKEVEEDDETAIEKMKERAKKRIAEMRKPADQQLAELAKNLKSASPEERIAAARELGKRGRAASAATKALCEATLDSSESVRQVALQALEKVNPTVYEPVLMLLVDQNPLNHIKASRVIGIMKKEEATAAVPVLCRHLKLFPGNFRPSSENPFSGFPSTNSVFEDIETLSKIAPDNSEVVEAFIEIAEAPHERSFLTVLGDSHSPKCRNSRMLALSTLGQIASEHPLLRKQIVPFLISTLEDYETKNPKGVGRLLSPEYLLVVIASLQAFGSDSKDAIPVLTKLKLDPNLEIRKAASAALEKISKPE